MSGDFQVEITHLDASVETVIGTLTRIHDGVLHVHRDHGTATSSREHVGSWPLVSIRSWRTTPRR